jgi:hypothetical protein
MAPTATKDDNVFDDPNKALEWAEKRNIDPAALRRMRSTGGLRDGASMTLVFRTITFTSGISSLPDATEFETSCLLTKRTLEALGGRFQHLAQQPVLGPFKIGPMQGHKTFEQNDVGMFATDEIPIGGTIVVEHPLLISPTYICLSSLAMTKSELYKMLFQRLPQPLKKLAEKLKSVKPPPCSREEGIVRTNGIAIELHSDEHGEGVYSGVFLNVARCNHRYVHMCRFRRGSIPS